jgi:simple sugar transport system permease protein
VLSASQSLGIRKAVVATVVPVATLVLALLLAAIVVVVAGASPINAYVQLFTGAFGNTTNIAETITRSTPIILTGVGMGLAFRAGLFNIGGEGQMIVGAVCTAITGLALASAPAVVLLPLSILVGCAAGAFWAALAGWWQAQFRVPLLLTTLLLNYVAGLIGSYLVSFPAKDPDPNDLVAETAMVSKSIQLPIILTNTPLHIGVIAILIIPLAVAWVQRRTVLGYTMRMTGLNPRFAEYGGVNRVRTIMITMLLSGGICGLAGAIEVLGVYYRYTDGMIAAPGTAWTGFIAALITGADPILTVFSGLLLGGLVVGASYMESTTSVPLQLANVIQAIIIFMVAFRFTLGRILRRATGAV